MNIVSTAMQNVKKFKYKVIDPIFSWPITRERYRQVLIKKHMYWQEIQHLLLEINRLQEELEKERASK